MTNTDIKPKTKQIAVYNLVMGRYEVMMVGLAVAIISRSEVYFTLPNNGGFCE